MAITLDEIRLKFSAFLAANPASQAERITSGPHAGGFAIAMPWGDPSVRIVIPKECSALAKALNSVVLPERLSAIYHRDERKLEIIWTALPFPDVLAGIETRQFTFAYKGQEHRCAFGESSASLMEIAKHSRILFLSETMNRNLSSFIGKTNYSSNHEWRGKPLCFWIDNIDYLEDETISLLSNLNFYMGYYDHYSRRLSS